MEEWKVKRCPKCNSSNTVFTGTVKYSSPGFEVYRCKDCGNEFDVKSWGGFSCVRLDLSKDVTKEKIKQIILNLVATGNFCSELEYEGSIYNFYRYVFGKCYYEHKENKQDFIHVDLDTEIKDKATSLFNYINESFLPFI